VTRRARKERLRVAAMYSSEDWRNKVAAMSDQQVFAIYMRLQEDEPQHPSVKVNIRVPKQLRLF
jgi:hypothetical protein